MEEIVTKILLGYIAIGIIVLLLFEMTIYYFKNGARNISVRESATAQYPRGVPQKQLLVFLWPVTILVTIRTLNIAIKNAIMSANTQYSKKDFKTRLSEAIEKQKKAKAAKTNKESPFYKRVEEAYKKQKSNKK